MGDAATLDEIRELLAPITKALNERVQGEEVAAAQQVEATQTAVQATAAAPTPSRIVSLEDRMELSAALRRRSERELYAMFAEQATKKNTGIPLDVWLSRGGNARLQGFETGMERELDPQVLKLLDTGGGAALIRQDLEPVLWEIFVRDFPALDRFAAEPANGLVHTYQQHTGFGDAQWMPELGTVTDDRGTYQRMTTNIGILATRRGVSFKNQFATVQSGSGFDPAMLEMRSGLYGIKKKLQDQIFSGHATDSGGSSSNELGAYDANAFTGLRAILDQSWAQNFQFDLDATTDPFRIAIDQVCVSIMNQTEAKPSIVYLNPIEHARFNESQDKNVRINNTDVEIRPGVKTNGVNTIAGLLPLVSVPGTSAIGSYTTTSGGSHSVRDVYVLDESTITMPYLGSEGLTVLELPPGVSGQLTRMFIIFIMRGLAVRSVYANGKARAHVDLA